MVFTKENLQAISQYVGNNICDKELRENLVDHICCAVEEKMKKGLTYETALHLTLQEVAPEGLREIEKELYYLLNYKFIIMKKVMYFGALMFCVSACFGFVLKVLHKAGSNELLILGLGGIAFLVTPILYTSRPNRPMHEKLAFLSLILFSFGGICKVFHWVSANELLLLGAAFFSFGFLPKKFMELYRESIAG